MLTCGLNRALALGLVKVHLRQAGAPIPATGRDKRLAARRQSRQQPGQPGVILR
jgi:hypothetical protein